MTFLFALLGALAGAAIGEAGGLVAGLVIGILAGRQLGLQRITLWGVFGAGVPLIAAMAWRLRRGLDTDDADIQR